MTERDQYGRIAVRRYVRIGSLVKIYDRTHRVTAVYGDGTLYGTLFGTLVSGVDTTDYIGNVNHDDVTVLEY